MVKHLLDPTSAAIMKLSKPAFSKDIIDNYIKHYDLTPANNILSEIELICKWYSEDIINRQYFLNSYLKKQLNNSEQEYLVLFLAAGKLPHTIELLKDNNKNINRVLEIDISGMDEKKEIYDVFYSEISNKVKCITADIKSDSILTMLNTLLQEYYHDTPCIIILENVSLTLEKSDLEKIVSCFKSTKHNNIFMLDYFIPYKDVKKERQHIPRGVLELLKKTKGLSNSLTITPKEIEEIFNKFNGKLLTQESLMEIEKERTGNNKFFKTKDEGWAACSVWEI